MKTNSMIILFIILGSVIISYIALNNLMLSAIILGIGMLFIYIAKKNNRNRKENLNIMRDENKLYFYLSDDLLYSINIPKDQPISATLRDSVNKEMATIKEMTRKICFINFKNDTLLKELNQKLHFI